MRYLSVLPSSYRRGFTLVEVLAISPIVILTVGVIVAFMVSISGNALQSRERAIMVYDIQSGLDQLESDIRLSTAIAPSSGTLPAGQGFNLAFTGTTAFTSNANALVLRQYTTSSNPSDPNRSLLYYANEPNPCGASQVYNIPVEHMIIYYRDGTDLKRRTVVNLARPVCGIGLDPNSHDIWQRNSCKAVNRNLCLTLDTTVVRDVSNLRFEYFRRPNDTFQSLPVTHQTTTVRAVITATKTVAGSSLSHRASVRVERIH